MDEVQSRADAAMYEAKRTGGHCFHLSPGDLSPGDRPGLTLVEGA